jgi:hypothetical protein
MKSNEMAKMYAVHSTIICKVYFQRHGSQKNNSVQQKLYYNVGIQILAASKGTSEPYMKSVIMLQVLDLNNSSKQTFV